MKSLTDGFPWGIDDIHTGMNSWDNTRDEGRILGGPSTEADFDMEGPFEPFVPQELEPFQLTQVRTAKQKISATGSPIRAKAIRAATVQNAV